MNRILIILLAVTSLSAQANTQVWVTHEKAVILLEGNSIERDAINLYDSMSVRESARQVDGLAIAYKQINYRDYDGSPLLDIFCSKSTDGTDLGQCFITVERSLFTWMDEDNKQVVLNISKPVDAHKLSQMFSGMNRSGNIYYSRDGRFGIFVNFINGSVAEFILKYIP